MSAPRFVKPALAVIVFVALVAVAYSYREVFRRDGPTRPVSGASSNTPAPTATTGKIIVSEPAQKNLGIVAKPMKVETYWKTISVPGMVVDRPGVSDREIVAPAVGTISQILHVPGDTVKPGDTLFTLKLLSESVQQSEAELYKASREIRISEAQRERLVGAGGAIAQSRVIEVESEIKRLNTAVEAYRYELRNYGLSDSDIEGVTDGRFVAEIPIVVPPRAAGQDAIGNAVAAPDALTSPERATPVFEVQKLTVGVGQQVQAGEPLCLLSNHEALAIEGRAFRDEAALVERSLKEDWPVEVDFQENAAAEWPPTERSLPIRHISNTIDPATRTFAFLVQLSNQAKSIDRDGKTQLIWRFRPGQKVRINIRTDRLDNVFVLPADAVAREGPEAYVFTQNVNTFDRKSVHVVYQDRDHAVIANDGAFQTYVKNDERLTIAAVVRGAAAQLNRMMKSGPAAVPKGYHIHADGSLHKNDDEGK